MSKYKTIRGVEVETTQKLPGVWKCREPGKWLVRGRKTDKRTGKLKEVKAVVTAKSAKAAYQELQNRLEEVLDPTGGQSGVNFETFSYDLLERKKTLGEIRSTAGISKWNNVLKHHLVPVFGSLLMTQLERRDVEAWKLQQAKRANKGEISPTTFNKWLSVLKVIMGTAAIELDLDKDPMRGVKPLDTSTVKRYDMANPNALPIEKMASFLERAKQNFPKYYAAMYLGFATGLRPSSIRPLRRKGKDADLLWDQGILLVRRSHTLGQVAMDRTKTGKDVVIHLPKEVMEVLKWHQENVLTGSREKASDLLFPARDGRFHGQTWLRKPFNALSDQMELGYQVTPKSMRRTFQDLTRSAGVHDLVTRSISGHSTEVMQFHYSSVNADEQRAAVGQVVKLFAA